MIEPVNPGMESPYRVPAQCCSSWACRLYARGRFRSRVFGQSAERRERGELTRRTEHYVVKIMARTWDAWAEKPEA